MATPLSGNQFFDAFLSGGDMGRRIREYDWTSTPLGPVNTWSPGLQSALSICLHSNFPIAIYWGEDLVLLYNDAWSPIPGNKHPWALGKPAIEVWPEIWSDIQPQFEKAFSGTPGGSNDALLPMQRNGYTEECYFDFTFTPILGTNARVEGVFNAVIETTHRVVHNRRTTFLQKLTEALSKIYEQEKLFDVATALISENPYDIPFCAFFRAPGDEMVNSTKPIALKKSLPADELLQSGETIRINHIDEYFQQVPAGPWAEQPKEALLIPLRWQDGTVFGYMLAGVSSRRLLDAEYQAFFESVAGTLVTVSNTLKSLEHERKKLEALAEIDRAKTIFFSNISHEFRTPLTLLLGPVEEALADGTLNADNKFRLQIVQRNARRLQKLVNNLLDFSRLEAGRLEASFSKTDLGALTTDLASNFRSAVEKAGIALKIQALPISDDVYVDYGMWEKIIFNLLSNAFKYTRQGEISVTVKQEGKFVLTEVADTGTGIPESELNRVFERFHRVANDRGRSQEGTGIGLAMVRELVRLHGGEISAASVQGEGSVFTITIPTGNAHLDSTMIRDAPNSMPENNDVFIDESAQWANTQPAAEGTNGNVEPKSDELLPGTARRTILLAEDNPDIYQYLSRLLSQQFNVIGAHDGETAYRLALAEKPALIISDIMMPVLDGFGLLKKIRGHLDIRNTPLIFLSARAGEEARVEGLNAGADDYLIKPFSSHELLARVRNVIRVQEVRRQTEQQFYSLFMQAPAIINVFRGPEFRYELYHPKNKSIFGEKDFTGLTLTEAHPELESQEILDIMKLVYQEGRAISSMERCVQFKNENGELEDHFFNSIFQPWLDANGQIQGILNFAIEITDMVKVRRRIENSEQYFRRLTDSLPTTIWITNVDGECEYLNKNWYDVTGQTKEESMGLGWVKATHPDDAEEVAARFMEASNTRTPFISLYRLRQKDGSYRWSLDHGEPRFDKEGNFEGLIGSVLDVHEQKLATDSLKESEEQFRNLAEMLPQLVWITDADGAMIYACNRWAEFTGKQPSAETWPKIIHPQDLPVVTRMWERSLREAVVYRAQMRLLRKDGEYFWFYVQGVPVLKDDGTVSRWIGSCTNIQEQKQIEHQLESLIAERTDELQRSNNDLQQFAHVASHDLKEPLRKIRTFAGRLREDKNTTLSEKGAVYLSKLYAATDRMMMMIEGVLNYSMLNGDEQLPDLIELSEIVSQAEQDLELLIQQKNAVITTKDLPAIEGARVLIYQLFYNLINNALKFTNEETPARISIEGNTSNDNSAVTITIKDNGIGFDPEFGEKIFDAFTRLNSRDRYEGTGLGLSLCKRIVQRHHGSISATGIKGNGASFKIVLPLKQSQPII